VGINEKERYKLDRVGINYKKLEEMRKSGNNERQW
jgi:hypothetical protein